MTMNQNFIICVLVAAIFVAGLLLGTMCSHQSNTITIDEWNGDRSELIQTTTYDMTNNVVGIHDKNLSRIYDISSP